MESKYKDIDDSLVTKYLEGLVNKVYKILPMKEENNQTLDTYLESLLFELAGFSRVFTKYEHSQDFVALIATLDSLLHVELEFPRYRREVLKCIGLCKKIK